MPTKVERTVHEAQPLTPEASGTSGTLVIIGMVAVAVAAAAASWWFRYNATHKAAKFWGPKATKLIRDAPTVTFYYFIRDVGTFDDPGLLQKLPERSFSGEVDVSKARGFTHLRNALLEDESFDWDFAPKQMPIAGWVLRFRTPTSNEQILIVFSHSGDYCALLGQSSGPRVISCEPISAGLMEMFKEFSAVPP